ncbi:hypothetical protein JZK55_15190 [Dissulfurispira thermophila]|uniref:Uncharacterized protein n=1 Tax=Dissulfurispira thermophila TaxID=2715679 RepID=A0A7G1H4C4_9BACT|nr:type II toxin-antitoxin system VapB family antitoxin [Dissulfurispira thermophila]BCB96597.1 hypothetical protein JZK55_15190 [Dissulfurispira thermophila]
MRVTLNIPDDLISEVQKATDEKSRTKAIIKAMEEFIRHKKIKELISLRGKVKIDHNLSIFTLDKHFQQIPGLKLFCIS